MKATYKDLYKKRSDAGELITVFRYTLTGKTADLERYTSILEGQGVPVHTDEASGKLLYFDTIGYGKTCEVTITDNDKIVVTDTTLDFLQSQLRLATDASVKSALAGRIADYMMAKITGIGNPTSAPVAVATEVPAVETEETEEIEEAEPNL